MCSWKAACILMWYFGRDVVGRDEDIPHVFGHLGEVGDGAVLGDLLHQLVGVEAPLPGDLLEERVDLDQLVVVHDLADEGDREQRLDTGGCAGDDGDGAGRGDGGDGGVAHASALPGRSKIEPLKFGKAPRSSPASRE